ncbi:MAG: NAD-dependent malic enzyme [Acidimicrobiia bacterium]
MRYQPATDTVSGQPYLPVSQRGRSLLDEPLLNKGSAFPLDERIAFGLMGLLPSHVSTIEEQVMRNLDQLAAKSTDLEKHIFLASLHDRNETLFYRLVVDHLEELVPLIYTPTVAEACRLWSHIFRRARGLYITPADRGSVEQLLRNAAMTEAAVIVITDNERILGIGDQGAGGMGIPIGKLALYTAAAGIHPSLCLPISLDVGTDNRELLDDPLYLGYRSERLRGDEYWTLVDEVVEAVRKVHPGAILQWEDFGNRTSFRHLDKYREVLPSFNDDIQGTAAMVIGGLFAAMRMLGARISDQRVVIAGAGSAGIGIARQIKAAMEQEGLDATTVRERILLTDSRGLVVDGREGIEDRKQEFAADPNLVASWGDGPIELATVIDRMSPSILIGVTGKAGSFTESMIRSMAAHHERPIVMPLSNPTKNTEATPPDIIRWSEGRALVATGSPFAPVEHEGELHRIGQANNVFVFPGIGLGAVVARASKISVGMFLAAARALADFVTDDTLKTGSLYPPITDVRALSKKVALAVIEVATREGIGQTLVDPEAAVDAAMWEPVYLPYRAG